MIKYKEKIITVNHPDSSFITYHLPLVQFIEFEIGNGNGIIDPHQLCEAIKSAPVIRPGAGVILSGKGPIWLFASLVHNYHATQFVACYDPRLAGAVVVQSHMFGLNVGAILVVKS